MATYVTNAELRANLGIGQLYSDAVVDEVCQAAEDVVKKKLWFNEFPVVGAGIYQNNAYITLASPTTFVAGQTVTITDCGDAYNGTYTITSTYPWTPGSASFPYFTFYPWNTLNYPRGYSLIQFAKTQADETYHLIVPYGKCADAVTTGVDYATVAGVREATMLVAVDIWQARQQSSIGGVSPDFQPSPYRMGNTLMARVRGLIAPYTSPRSMVG